MLTAIFIMLLITAIAAGVARNWRHSRRTLDVLEAMLEASNANSLVHDCDCERLLGATTTAQNTGVVCCFACKRKWRIVLDPKTHHYCWTSSA